MRACCDCREQVDEFGKLHAWRWVCLLLDGYYLLFRKVAEKAVVPQLRKVGNIRYIVEAELVRLVKELTRDSPAPVAAADMIGMPRYVWPI